MVSSYFLFFVICFIFFLSSFLTFLSFCAQWYHQWHATKIVYGFFRSLSLSIFFFILLDIFFISALFLPSFSFFLQSSVPPISSVILFLSFLCIFNQLIFHMITSLSTWSSDMSFGKRHVPSSFLSTFIFPDKEQTSRISAIYARQTDCPFSIASLPFWQTDTLLNPLSQWRESTSLW